MLLLQGFLKHHPSLTSLITHHSVMPELLPVRKDQHYHNTNMSAIYEIMITAIQIYQQYIRSTLPQYQYISNMSDQHYQSTNILAIYQITITTISIYHQYIRSSVPQYQYMYQQYIRSTFPQYRYIRSRLVQYQCVSNMSNQHYQNTNMSAIYQINITTIPISAIYQIMITSIPVSASK